MSNGIFVFNKIVDLTVHGNKICVRWKDTAYESDALQVIKAEYVSEMYFHRGLLSHDGYKRPAFPESNFDGYCYLIFRKIGCGCYVLNRTFMKWSNVESYITSDAWNRSDSRLELTPEV